MKNAKGGKKLKDGMQRSQSEVPAAQTGKSDQDARDDPRRQRRNREQMGVTEDHRTEDMAKKNRGTFP